MLNAMDTFVLVQGLCHAKIWRLLLIIGIAVVVIVFQCFALSYQGRSSPQSAKEESVDMLVNNATLFSNLRSTKPYTFGVVMNNTIGFYSQEETDYGNKNGAANLVYYPESDISKNLDDSYRNEFTKKQSIVIKDITIAGNSKGIGNSNVNYDISSSFLNGRMSSAGSVEQTTGTQGKNPNLSPIVSAILTNNSVSSTPLLKSWKMQPVSISRMNSILLHSVVSSRSVRPRRSSVRDRELLSAKQKIENAAISRNTPGLYASVYWNISKFIRSYDLMEDMLKVYIYKEGAKPIFHQPKRRGIYASEGWFMKLMEGNKKFAVRDPRRAHLFYLPFSASILRTALGQNFQGYKDLQQYLKNYVELIGGRYRFWNRTDGADHFLVSCHDWAPKLTKYMRNCLRVLCNANAAKDFKIGKDTTLPVTYIRSAEAPLEDLGGRPPSERPTLAFFAGSMHGYLRPILLQHWENKEPDMKIFGPMPRDIEGKKKYREHMKSSKYCICARGYEVHTPRVVEAIYHECVPVIISDNYVPPFFEVLNWETFSVFVQEKDILNLRNILLSIPEKKYLEMQTRVKLVQQHFLWHKKPVKYDLFHMILHSVWYNRIFQIKSR
ncbi:hypothetical protein SLEP1_g18533 [Rubroshorea leprosula]|uniref:Exostosin GT47 domain-containing protein n=1 Tax=Rubroshorea leprosula TaxID=152421 RepID=A0AAV5J8E8_9ROSI|nr:hypothetical protein SLEP1_g18533 [Rubroshorea leprosula]